MNKHIIYILSFCISLLFVMSGCVDDRLYLNGGEQDGYATLNLEASFQPFETSDLTRASSGYEGQSMKGLSDLAVILYDEEGNIVEGYPKEINFTQNDLKSVSRDKNNTANNLETAEKETYSLENVRLGNIPYGKYYIVAVANLGIYNDESDGNMSTFERLTNEINYKEAIKTLQGLRKIKLDWDKNNLMNNREMLGYFADPEASAPNSNSEFPLITVNSHDISLRAWLRRAASKITVDIDGSALRENIYVYVKDVKIYDIAGECTLGFGKESDVPNAQDGVVEYNNSISDGLKLIHDISTAMPRNAITFGVDSEPTKWPCITRGVPHLLNSSGTKANLHREDSPAIFFYENMQGDAPHGKIPEANLVDDNTDIVDKDGTATDEQKKLANFKDGLDNGTYIEVTAYYVSDTGDQSMTSGHEIRYRFMLGKDVEKNCDAERNIHYKLTLSLRGNAKEYDWHIDYEENEGFDVPNPWYVSYLYNHKSMMPFKFTLEDGYELQNIEAEIIVNPWYPYIESSAEGKDEQPGEVNDYIGKPSGEMVTDQYNDPINKSTGNGFLSLRSTFDKVILTANDVSDKSFEYNDNDENTQFNQAYFVGTYPTDGTAIAQNKRTYSFDGTADNTNTGDESYSYVKNGNVYTFTIPLFTRQKALVKQTGYSGNNYFAGYPRRAKLRLKATVKNKETGEEKEVTKIVNVIQVRRIENPKGIYRKAGNNEDFHVRLLHLQGEDKTYFSDFDSRGPWLAEVIGDQNFITIDGKQTKYGSTGTNIDFTIRFNKTSTESDHPKNAIVRVLYHNYTCTHLIFVRQGYEPQQISGKANQLGENGVESEVDGAYWGTFNMITSGVAASDPRDEGSLFRFGNADDAIDAVNNIYGDTNGDGDGKYAIPTDVEFTSWSGEYKIASLDNDRNLTNSVTKKWKEIGVFPNDDKNQFKAYEIATIRDYEQLYRTPFVQFGFGVLYADGATDTQYDIKQAFGYYREAKDNTRGIRGLFAYYWNPAEPGNEYTAHNVFFPIGRSGYGHRKQGKSFGWRNSEDPDNWNKGILRYSCGRYEPALATFGSSAPIFVNLYRRQGAIYWARNIEQNWLGIDGLNDKPNERAVGLDINYFSMDVNGINEVDIDVNDACFVRLMKTNNGN